MFFIVWGKKIIERKKGFVADFCPICSRPYPFVFSSINLVNHVYYIPLGFGKTEGYLGCCFNCGTNREMQIEDFTSVLKQKPLNIRQLIRDTRPLLAEDYAQRLILERDIQKGKLADLDGETRKALLQEKFDVVESKFLGQYESTNFDKQTKFGCIGTLLFAFFGFFILQSFSLANPGSVSIQIFLLIVFLATCVTLFFAVTVNPRHIKNWVLPTLARGLRPLRPTRKELEEILKARHSVSRLYKKIKAMKLLDIIDLPNRNR